MPGIRIAPHLNMLERNIFALVLIDMIFNVLVGFFYDDVIKWKQSPRYRAIVKGIQQITVEASHKGQWRFSLIYAWIIGWASNRDAGNLRYHRCHYYVFAMAMIR